MTLRRLVPWLAWGRLVPWLAWGLAACAGSQPPSQERIDAAFRAIQRGEARIEAAAREVDRVAATIADGAGACVERCQPLSHADAEAREGAATVCDNAAAIADDDDARVRCERARTKTTALARRAGELAQRCGCGQDESAR